MKALIQTDVESLDLQDVPRPEVASGSSLVEIKAVGICGSDMHAYLGHDERRPTPLILGHEAAGVVAEGPEAGRRVTINPLVTCGRCEYCTSGRTNLCPHRQIISMPPREGAFAEYVAIPNANLVTVPPDVSFAKAALTEPIACGWHAVRLCQQTLNKPMAGLECVVIGGGAIGVGAALALLAVGAGKVTIIEPNDLRRFSLSNIEGLTAHAPGSSKLPPHGSAAIVIDGVGYAATRADACDYVMPGGVIAHIGLGEATGGLDVRRMTLQEIQFIGCYTYTTGDFKATAQAIFQGRLGKLDWMDIRPMSEGAQAFKDILAGEVAAPKVILEP